MTQSNIHQYEHLAGVVLASRYKLLRHITTTKMSVVYQAFDIRKNLGTAIKIHLSQEPRQLKLFEREAELARRLRHDHIVSSYDHNTQGELVNGLTIRYIALVWVDGISLHENIQRNAAIGKIITLQQASAVLVHVAEALEYAHANRIIHRDVKPTNVLMDVRRGAMLIDFGIAKIKPAEASSAKPTDTIGGKVESMGSGGQDKRSGLGAIRYRAPEQIIGIDEVNERCDQYSLAITIYEYLSNGVSPYQEWLDRTQESRDNAMNVRHSWDAAHVQGALTPLTTLRPDIPASVWNVLKRALERDPHKRYPDCLQFADHFTRAVNAQAAKTDSTANSDKTQSSRSSILRGLQRVVRQLTNKRPRSK